jgi:hypothetical protein
MEKFNWLWFSSVDGVIVVDEPIMDMVDTNTIKAQFGNPKHVRIKSITYLGTSEATTENLDELEEDYAS